MNGAQAAPVTHWFGKNRTMRDDGNRYVVTNLLDDVSMIVNRETQTYQVVPLNLEPNHAIPEVTVTPTTETRIIGKWPARRYRLSGPATRELSIDIWTTEDLEVDFSAFRTLMIKLGNRPGSEWLKAYKTIPGFPVLQEVELSRPGLRLMSQSQVIAVEEVEVDEKELYAPPTYFRRLP